MGDLEHFSLVMLGPDSDHNSCRHVGHDPHIEGRRYHVVCPACERELSHSLHHHIFMELNEGEVAKAFQSIGIALASSTAPEVISTTNLPTDADDSADAPTILAATLDSGTSTDASANTAAGGGINLAILAVLATALGIRRRRPTANR